MVGMETTRFLPYTPGQMMLLPPDLREWLEEGHLAYFILDVVEALDLSEIYASYDGSRGGRPGFDPRLLVGLLVYGYCVGVTSSRKIEKATHESVPFRVLAANQHPDHATIAEFRRRHLEALARLFVQILRLCEKAGLVRLGHVALDGTKMRANASKHKAMSYGRMEEKVRELEAQVADLLAAAEAADQAEDAQHGSRRGDELPDELRFRQQRLEKIREAMAALEAEAEATAQKLREEKEAKAQAKGKESAPIVVPDGEPAKAARPAEQAQKNFTDADSRIMRDGATKSFEQFYNCQAAVENRHLERRDLEDHGLQDHRDHRFHESGAPQGHRGAGEGCARPVGRRRCPGVRTPPPRVWRERGRMICIDTAVLIWGVQGVANGWSPTAWKGVRSGCPPDLSGHQTPRRPEPGRHPRDTSGGREG